MRQDQIDERIEDYLKGKLSVEEQQKLEWEMEENEQLKQEVELYLVEHELMKELVREGMQKKMEQWDRELQEKEKSSPPIIRLWAENRTMSMAIAASFVLLLAAAFWVFRDSGLADPNEVAQTETNSFDLPVLLLDESGLGIAGKQLEEGPVKVRVIQDGIHEFHYRFKDNLELFFANNQYNNSSTLKLLYDTKKDQYRLILEDEVYALDRGFNDIYPLKLLVE